MCLRSIRLYLIVLVTGLVSGIGAKAHYLQSSSEQHAYDSASFFAESGKVEKARLWIGRALKTPQDLEEKGRTYLILGDLEESEGYSLPSLDAYRRSIACAHQVSDYITESSARRGIATVFIGLARYDSVLIYLSQSLRLDSSRFSQMMNDLVTARYWQVRNQHDKALAYFQTANDKANELHVDKYKAMALAGMAGIYFYQEPDMKKTLRLHHESIALWDSSKHANLIARGYGRIANANMVLGNGREAERYLNRAKRITDISGNLPVRAYILSSLAILKAEDGDVQGAVRYAEEPARIKRKLGQTYQLQNDLLNLSEYYMYLKEYKKAREAIREGLQISTGLKDVVYIQYFYERASRLDSLTGNFLSAYSNLKKAMTFKDSVIEVQRVNAVEELREKYEAEQKEKTIAEKELVIQYQKYQQAMIVGASAVALLVFIVMTLVIRNRHKLRFETEKRKQDQQRLQTIVHTQEEVQQSIARDIHDGLVQVLGAAKVSLEAIQEHGDKQVIMERIRNARQIMDEACVEARSISHQLLPYSLLKDGLVPALDELFRKSLGHYEFVKKGEPEKINGDAAINIYRIAQEVVNNILKHAEAGHVDITLSSASGFLVLEIRDNGKGFDATSSVNGAGLMNMQTRAEVIRGSLEIQSAAGKGTRVQLTVPI